MPPFADLKVLDLAWVVAGPAIGRVLADYGATVVRVETSKRIETARLMGPFPQGRFDPERSALYDNYNTNKLGLTIDLAHPQGQVLVRRLAAWADVVVESFAPGQMARWELGYDSLRRINPSLVVLSTSLMGQTGPYAAFAGYGNIGAAMAGYQGIVGWPDKQPVGPYGPYTDFVGPRFGLVALLAALDHRRRTGEGAWLDISQAEAGIQFLAPEIARAAETGHNVNAEGNRDPSMAPHGVFRCLGDKWIALAVRSDAEWNALANHIGSEALAAPDLATLAGRKACEARLEELLSDWLLQQDAWVIERDLQAIGVPAHIVAASEDIVSDPQLRWRRHFVELPHPNGGVSVTEASRFGLSRTPAEYQRCAPTFGRDTEFVLQHILGCSKSEVESLTDEGVLT